MDTEANVYLTSPEPVEAHLSGRTPCIRIGDIGNSAAHIRLHSTLLTPVEQVDWLRRLAHEAEALAVQVAALHAEPVGASA